MFKLAVGFRGAFAKMNSKVEEVLESSWFLATT